MQIRKLMIPTVAIASLGLGACSQNYAVEGAGLGAAAGAGVAAVTGEDVATGAAIGAAAGAAGGALIKKDGNCYRRGRDGELYQVSCDG